MTLAIMKYFMCTAIALSIVRLPQNGVYGGRQEFKASGTALEAPPNSSTSLRLLQSENFLLEQLLAAANENRDAYMKLKNYYRRQPNYALKWPVVRELPLTSFDYDSNLDANNLDVPLKNDENVSSRFMERLRQLSDTSTYRDDLENVRENENVDELEIAPKNYENLDTNQLHLKSYDTKKHFKFMAPCHFKICSVGKRFA